MDLQRDPETGLFRGIGKPHDTYAELVEQIRRLVAEGKLKRTLDREQAISFAYGNTCMSNPAVTREMVEAAYDRLHPLEP